MPNGPVLAKTQYQAAPKAQTVVTTIEIIAGIYKQNRNLLWTRHCNCVSIRGLCGHRPAHVSCCTVTHFLPRLARARFVLAVLVWERAHGGAAAQ